MNGVMAEALEKADGEEDVEKKIEAALACPCLGDLKEGACGPTFVHAFCCFVRSEREDKGMDCLDEFKAFQVCLQQNPEHLAKIMAANEAALPEDKEQQEGGTSSTGAAAAAAAAAPATQQLQQQAQAPRK